LEIVELQSPAFNESTQKKSPEKYIYPRLVKKNCGGDGKFETLNVKLTSASRNYLVDNFA